ncbi:AAA family ATPase [Agromyces aerolatus]|uniref:AAA family ATPase n=1 Tax=Agromyces sp. LY-1074 TaxID=3074080 RepID=UPI002856A0ED|nr:MULTISPECIES: regulator [unclassified Agromyces]MDR5699829.1 regulator [Agromyces sp. LY-1074]MDR5706359.1 regulator [Agromyces sp. LY-1358]
MARLIVALDVSTEDRVLADLVEAGHQVLARVVGWRDVLERLDEGAPDVVIVGAGRGTLSAELLDGCDRRGIRLIALAADDRDRALTTRLGLHEVLDADVDWRELERLVRGGLPAPPRRGAGGAEPASGQAPAGGDRGRAASVRLVSVWGPAGAPGRTTLAINFAAELAATGRNVALVDADPYGGAVATALGLLDEAPGFAAACRLAASGALDRAELERVARRYSSSRGSFDVFTGLVGPSRWPELGADRVSAALTEIRARFDVVVVDTGFSLERDEALTSDQFAPRRNAATFSALGLADRVVAVGLADPIGLSRLVRGYAELAEHVETERVEVVVNRVRSGTLGIDAHVQIRHTLRRFAGIGDVTLLADEPRAADAAIRIAKTLRDAAPRSTLRASIRDFAAQRLTAREAASRRRAGLGRSRAPRGSAR